MSLWVVGQRRGLARRGWHHPHQWARDHAPRRLLDYLKREARKVLEARSIAFAARIGAVAEARGDDTASRWGRSVNVDFLLLAAHFRPLSGPVVAHEVAHLREMNHGPRFWRLVRSLVPDIDAPQAWLKKNGVALHRYADRKTSKVPPPSTLSIRPPMSSDLAAGADWSATLAGAAAIAIVPAVA